MKCLFIGGKLDHKEVDVEKPMPDVYKNTDSEPVEEYNIFRLGDRRTVFYVYALKGMGMTDVLKALTTYYTLYPL